MENMRNSLLMTLCMLAPGVASAVDNCPTDPDKDDPGYCGCEWVDLDLDLVPGAESCVHSTANVGAGATLHPGAIVSASASVGTDAVLGADALLAPRSHLGDDATLDDLSVAGRSSFIGNRSIIGTDSQLGRATTVGEDVEATFGTLVLGYAASVGDRTRFTGPNVTVGNLAEIGSDAVIGGSVVIARSAYVGIGANVGERTTIGPEVEIEDGTLVGNMVSNGVVIGENVRLRKNAIVEAGADVGDNTRIGRDVVVAAGADVGEDVTIRSGARIGMNVVVADGTYIPRGTILEDVVLNPYGDAAPVVVITSPSHGVDVDGSTITITGTLSDDYGIDRVTVRFDDGVESDIAFATSSFSASLTVPNGTQSIRITAWDTSGQPGSDVLLVSDCNTGISFGKTWTGTASSDWSNGANWSPSGIPANTDDVFVCGSLPNQPTLTGNVEVAGLWIDSSSELSTDGYTVTANGDVTAGLISGSGTLILPGTSNLRGVVPNLQVRGITTLSGYTRAEGDTTLLSGDRLNVAGRTLDLQGDLAQYYGGSGQGLGMTDALSMVTVEGDALFQGSSTMNNFTAGILRVRGDLTGASSTRNPFRSTGTAVILDGTNPQTVSLHRAASGEARFHDLTITNPAGVTFSSVVASGQLYVGGDLTIADGSSLTSSTIIRTEVLGLTTLSGNAAFSAPGTFIANGELTLNGTTTLDIVGRLTAKQALEMADTSALTAGDVTLETTMDVATGTTLTADEVQVLTAVPRPSPNYNVNTTLISGNITLDAPWTHTVPDVYMDQNGSLTPNGHAVVLNADYEQYINAPSDGLQLTHAADDITFNGTALFKGSTSMTKFTHGVIRARGDLTAATSTQNPFRCHGTAVILDGISPQNVSLARGGAGDAYFDDLTITNTAGVTFSTVYVSGRLYVTGDLTLADGSSLTSSTIIGTEVLGLTTLNGSATFDAPGSFIANGELTLNGSATLDIVGRLTAKQALEMADTSALTAGDVTLETTMDVATGTTLTADEVQVLTAVPRPSPNYNVNTTLISGNITLDAPWTHTVPDVYMDQNGSLTPNGHAVVLNADYEQYINAPSDGLQLTHAADDITFNGTALFKGSTSMTKFTHGVIRARGDLTAATSTQNPFRCYGTAVILDGISPQAVSLARGGAGDAYFDDLTITNAAGVTFSTIYAGSSLYVAGDLEISGLLNHSNNGSIVLNDLDVTATGTLNNTGSMAYGGAFTAFLGSSVGPNMPTPTP